MLRRSTPTLVVLTLAGGLVALVLAFSSSLVVAGLAGLLALGAGLLAARARLRAGEAPDPGRRRALALLAGTGVLAVVGGGAFGRTLRRLTRPDPKPVLDAMAHEIGAETLELVRRTYHPQRSGDLQLVLRPWSTSNYAQESLSLLPRDPRSSHALPWMYLERVPIVVYAPGIVRPADNTDRVTLADLAPTTAHLIGFEGFEAADGRVLPGVERPAETPKVVVTFVIDGGGWNVLRHWPDAWPNLKRLMRGGAAYRNAIVGSSPAVTACAHATIGTGAFPRTHGITGHNIRDGGSVRKAYGHPGRARPSDILVPTLADLWTAETQNEAWVGEIGYQVWHLGMLGRGGTPLGEKPVGVYWDESRTHRWQPHNPDLYRLPKEVPPLDALQGYKSEYVEPEVDEEYERFAPGGRSVCCSWPVIRYQGDLIDATFRSEGLGTRDVADLLFVNYKSPDYTGHVYNMRSTRTRDALLAVDEQLGRLADFLLATFGEGGFALIVCADHGQCPTVDSVGGVRVDPIQLQEDIERELGGSVFRIVQSVVPSEIYLDERAMWDAGVTRDDVAAFLRDYRYGDNIGPYIEGDAIQRDRVDQEPFAAVLSTDFIAGLQDPDLARFGDGLYFQASDEGVPPVTW